MCKQNGFLKHSYVKLFANLRKFVVCHNKSSLCVRYAWRVYVKILPWAKQKIGARIGFDLSLLNILFINHWINYQSHQSKKSHQSQFKGQVYYLHQFRYNHWGFCWTGFLLGC
jgi:hypothetical protein